jgi:hypothetical protein
VTWRQRAERILGIVLATAEAEKPGDVEHALAAITAARRTWKITHEFACSAGALKVWGSVSAAAKRRLRAGPSASTPARCPACGAGVLAPCVPIAGEIKPRQTHAARGGQP